jgi:hypothetical protein
VAFLAARPCWVGSCNNLYLERYTRNILHIFCLRCFTTNATSKLFPPPPPLPLRSARARSTLLGATTTTTTKAKLHRRRSRFREKAVRRQFKALGSRRRRSASSSSTTHQRRVARLPRHLSRPLARPRALRGRRESRALGIVGRERERERDAS